MVVVGPQHHQHHWPPSSRGKESKEGAGKRDQEERQPACQREGVRKRGDRKREKASKSKEPGERVGNREGGKARESKHRAEDASKEREWASKRVRKEFE